MPENRSETGTVRGIEFTVTGPFLPYVPGRVNAPPEDCYPPEGGCFEEYAITVGDDEIDVTDVLDADVETEILRTTEEQAIWGRK